MPPPPPGAPVGYPVAAPAYAPPAPPPPAATAPTAPKDLKCPSCGAPLQPEFGDAVITCPYCGATVSLAGTGWKAVQRHSMLLPQVIDANQALAAVKGVIDQGLFHHHAFEESQVAEQKFQFVPYWIVPASATTAFTYQDIAVSAGTTIGTIAAAGLISGALGGGRRGGFGPVIPLVVAPPVNATRQDQITGSYQFPVVAVKGLMQYQPKNYQFNLDTRQPYNKSNLPGGAAVLNGDLAQDSAQQAARAYVTQAQADAAHKKHHMVSQVQTQVDVGDPELLHAPIWYFVLDHKGQRTVVLVDANANRVMLTAI